MDKRDRRMVTMLACLHGSCLINQNSETPKLPNNCNYEIHVSSLVNSKVLFSSLK